MTHKEYADSLRKIANFFEQHTELAIPSYAPEFKYYNVNGKREMALVAKALGKCEKLADGEWFKLIKCFGSIRFEAIDYREQICRKILVGKKVVPEQIVEGAPARASQVIPEHEEEVYEWHCPESLLEEEEVQP